MEQFKIHIRREPSGQKFRAAVSGEHGVWEVPNVYATSRGAQSAAARLIQKFAEASKSAAECKEATT